MVELATVELAAALAELLKINKSDPAPPAIVPSAVPTNTVLSVLPKLRVSAPAPPLTEPKTIEVATAEPAKVMESAPLPSMMVVKPP